MTSITEDEGSAEPADLAGFGYRQDCTGPTWWLRWSALLFIGISVVVGFLVHLRLRSRATSLEAAPAPVLGGDALAGEAAKPEGAPS